MNKLLFLLMGLFMLSSVYALGVTPGRTTVDFKPGLEREVVFEIINSGGEDVELSLSVDGELADYINFDSKRISILSSESSKTLSYKLALPANLEPGLRTGRIIIAEVPGESKGEESYVAATLAVAIQLHVNVPFPGKYATSSMVVYDAAPEEEVTFVFPVVSRGEFDLSSVRANVDIYNRLDEKIDSFNTAAISIPSTERKEIVYKWLADVPIGEYRAKATIIYDDGTINLEGFFNVGSKELELQEIAVSDFSLGEIVKLEMLVENKWSEPISDAHIETNILDEEGDVVANFESSSYDIKPLAKQVFVSYWDTAGVKVGNYQTDVSIYYGDKSSKKSLEFQVNDDSLTIVGLGYVISAESEGGGMNLLIVVLIIVIVLLILINLLWFLFLRKRLKR
jgi:hypothetical protein